MGHVPNQAGALIPADTNKHDYCLGYSHVNRHVYYCVSRVTIFPRPGSRIFPTPGTELTAYHSLLNICLVVKYVLRRKAPFFAI